MADPTEAQLKDAARKALAAGDSAAAKRLIDAARKVGSSQPAPVQQSPAMASGLAGLSSMTRNPTLVNAYDQGPATAARADAVTPPAAPSAPQNSAAGTAAQFGVGSQSGIANMLGFPVDALTGGINAIGGLTGAFDPIQNPIGGANSISALFAPLNKNIPAPQTGTERFARRVGEDVGASAAMLPVAALAPAFRAAPVKATGVEMASAIGSGTGAATANEIAPDSVGAEIIGALAGGIPAGMAANRLAGTGGANATVRGGIDEQRDIARGAYGEVRADARVLPQDSVDDMALAISAKMDAEKLNPRLQPGSAAILDAILQDSSGPMRIEDIENLRRLTVQSLPATASASDRRLAKIMTDEITAYLDRLADPVADALKDGRTAHRRASAAQAVADATEKATRRAARTGSGGNEINATRQNLSSIVENPRKARSFKDAELAAMDEIVRGTTGQNAMRRLSRFAPSSGGLSSMLGIGGALASPTIALPLMAVTEGAKALGERSTSNSILSLLQSLAPDRVLQPGQQGMNEVIAALLAARLAGGNQPVPGGLAQ